MNTGKMISIVVVYNNERALNDILLKSFKNQTVDYELITLDNTQGRFTSAAEALNYGGNKAKGKYIMFIHQDVELDSDSWLEKVENLLNGISDIGIAGVAGMSEQGRNFIERRRGYISDCGEIWGKPLEKAEVVETLDECLLIVPKSIFEKLQFDEKTFDYWHCYGADYCLCVRQMGLKAYAIPAFVYHRSLRSNVGQLLKYHEKLYNKHKSNYKRIHTTSGEISLKMVKLRCISSFFVPFYEKIFPNWRELLKRELSGCNTVLDLGCGYNSPIQYCDVPFSAGVELFVSYLQESKKKGIHNQYIKADIRKTEFKPKSFDAIIALDILEHLTKEEGLTLIKKIENWARKRIVIFTPNGYLWQDCYDNNPLQEHKSGWGVEELEKLGFKVIGINGWRMLRGYKATIKYKPKFLWGILSDFTQKVTYRYPKFAFQLLAIKQTDDKK